MALSWTLDDQADHLLVRVEGSWQLRPIFDLLDEIAGRCRDRGHARVLCDVREVQGPLSEITKYLAGTRIAEGMKTVRFAVLAAPDSIVTGFAGSVAARRGGKLFTTKSEAEARQWLFAPDPE